MSRLFLFEPIVTTVNIASSPSSTATKPTGVRFGVLAFCCVLSMVTYLDRVCFGSVAPYIQAEFGLSNEQLGYLFTAFALAYAAFEVPTGWLGDRFGARITLIRIVLWWSGFTVLTGLIHPTPTMPWLAFTALLVVRFLFGAGEAGAYPNISVAFARWFPFSERGGAKGAVWMFGRFGGGITPLVVLALVYTTVDSSSGETITHWRHIFWIFGALGVVWCVFFWWWFRDRPEDHPSVNLAELQLIQADQKFDPKSRIRVPWSQLASNLNLWLLCLMYFGASYGWYFNITWLPKYLKETYSVTTTNPEFGFWTTSLLTGAPLLLGALACLVGGLLTDGFIRATGNRKWGRRLFGAVGHSVCALCYFLALTANTPYLFVLFIALAAFWNDLTMGSAWASCIDIGGRYSGVVAGCMNTVGNLGGAVAGFATGWILQGFGQERGWTINLISFAGVYVLAALLWLRFDATKPVVLAVSEGS